MDYSLIVTLFNKLKIIEIPIFMYSIKGVCKIPIKMINKRQADNSQSSIWT